MLAKERFERIRVPLPKQVQDALASFRIRPSPFYLTLRPRHTKGYTQSARSIRAQRNNQPEIAFPELQSRADAPILTTETDH